MSQPETEFIYPKPGGIFLYNLENQTSTLFLPEEIAEKWIATDIIVSPDKKLLLALTDKVQDHTLAIRWRVALYDIRYGNSTQLAGNKYIRQCLFFRDHSLIYNFDNNLFYIEDVYINPEPLALTTDGIVGSIYNGIPDYVYSALFYRETPMPTYVSKDGLWVAIAYFDDTKVYEETFFKYGQSNSIEEQYPTICHLKYPEVGKTNPSVSVKVLNLLHASNATWITFEPLKVSEEEQILVYFTWASEFELAIVWSNRPQNKSVITICNVYTTKCENDFFIQESHGWIDKINPVFSRIDRKYYIDIIPIPQKNKSDDKWQHIAKHTRGNKLPEPITFGLKSVISIEGWREEENLIYYFSTLEDEPWCKHLFVAGSRSECISCNMQSPYNGEFCNFVNVTFSPGDKYFALTCDSQAPSYTEIYNAQTATRIMMWQDNAVLRKVIEEYHQPQMKYFRVTIPGVDSVVKMSLPPQFDTEDTNVAYPMIVHIYSGPGFTYVTKQNILDYETFWTTKRSYIYVRIEGRGTDLKGLKNSYSIYRKYGNLEIDDVINTTRHLINTYSWIDKNNVGLWGWSYGGYAALQGLVRDYYNIYKCGVSVAPLLDLQKFLSLMMERYMGFPTPDDNFEGYDNANFLKHALRLRGKKFAIMLGNADESTHYAKTMQLFHILQSAGIDFEQMSYPDEDHLLNGVLPHVYHFLDDFWNHCFSVP